LPLALSFGFSPPIHGAIIAVSLAVPQRCSAITTSLFDLLCIGSRLLCVLVEQLGVIVAGYLEGIVRGAENEPLEVTAPPAVHHFAGIANQTALAVLIVIGTFVSQEYFQSFGLFHSQDSIHNLMEAGPARNVPAGLDPYARA